MVRKQRGAALGGVVASLATLLGEYPEGEDSKIGERIGRFDDRDSEYGGIGD